MRACDDARSVSAAAAGAWVAIVFSNTVAVPEDRIVNGRQRQARTAPIGCVGNSQRHTAAHWRAQRPRRSRQHYTS